MAGSVTQQEDQAATNGDAGGELNVSQHGVACSLAGGPIVPREDAKSTRKSTTSSPGAEVAQTTSLEAGTVSSPGHSPAAQSPFSILTGAIERPSAGHDQSWQLDLQLMYHYTSNTKQVLTEQNDMLILRIWQEELPRVAFANDYVMHALLGFAALHKAHLEPGLATMLRATAVDHLDKALMLYRRETGALTPESANAKFAFTWLIALFSYAVPPSVPPVDAMVELLLLVKGIDAVLSETWYWVTQGPFAPILTRGFQEACVSPLDGSTYPPPDGMDFGLAHLDFMLGVDAMVPNDRRVCASVLAELKALHESVLQGQTACSVASIVCFPKQDPAAFAELIRRRIPQALIILSYYCVLLDVLNDRWWIRGWASQVLTDVLASLDPTWKHWVEWPIETILMKDPAVPSAGRAALAGQTRAMVLC